MIPQLLPDNPMNVKVHVRGSSPSKVDFEGRLMLLHESVEINNVRFTVFKSAYEELYIMGGKVISKEEYECYKVFV